MPVSKLSPAALLLVLLAISYAGGTIAPAHEGEHTNGKTTDNPGIGLEEKIGKKISKDAILADEKGAKRLLGDLIVKPTLLLPVYFTCRTTCGIMMANLARAVNDVPLALGRDYNILAFSFDGDDTPENARKARDNYSAILKKPAPIDAWFYLTGNMNEIVKITGSIGFSFKKGKGGDFFHPNTLIALSADGTIIRYLSGPDFLPFDIAMALTEAEKGTPSISIRKLLSYCFSYESEKKTYALKGVRIITGVLLLVMAVILFLLLRKKNPVHK